MDDKVPEFLDLEKKDESNIPFQSNVLPLGDLHEHDISAQLNFEKINTDKYENYADTSENLSNLDEQTEPISDNNKVVDETMAISKFAEEFVEPILKEVIARHKSEIEDEVNELHGENNVDKKSEKSSSDDGFEYVKRDDVIEEMHKETEKTSNDGDDVKRELEDVVFQEEIRLESSEKDVIKEIEAEYESGENETEDIRDNDNKKCGEDDVSEIIKNDVTELNYTEVDDLIKDIDIEKELLEEQEDVLRSMDNILDDAMLSETDIKENLPDYDLSNLEIKDETVTEHFSEKSQTILSTKNENINKESPSKHDIKGKCKDLINWKHPVSSALAFSILMLIELGLLMEYSIISLLAYSGLLLMIASFSYKVALYFRLINTQSSINGVLPFDKGDIEYCVDVTVEWIEYIHREIKSIAYVESFTKNVKVFIMLWILTYIGQMFNLQSLIFLGSLLLFSMPLVYGRFKTEIDGIFGHVQGVICGNLNKIKTKCQSMFGGGGSR